MSQSINLMATCNARKIFTYVFIGFPGSAHDFRVRNENDNKLFYKLSKVCSMI